MFEEIVKTISEIGYPIAISIFLLYRDTSVLKALTESINSNTEVLSKLVDKLSD